MVVSCCRHAKKARFGSDPFGIRCWNHAKNRCFKPEICIMLRTTPEPKSNQLAPFILYNLTSRQFCMILFSDIFIRIPQSKWFSIF